MLTPEQFERKSVFRKHKWNGGSANGGYDEYWLPLTAVDRPEDTDLFARRLSITFNMYGKGKVIVSLCSGGFGGSMISLPRVDTMDKILILAKLARIPCCAGQW